MSTTALPVPTDVNEGAGPSVNGPVFNTLPSGRVRPPVKRKVEPEFPDPLPLNEYVNQDDGGGTRWVWEGFIPFSAVSLLEAGPKAGKTTLLAHLFGAISRGEPSFLGAGLTPTKVLIVTEEPRSVWKGRLDQYGLNPDLIHVQAGQGQSPRPFRGNPTDDEWKGFVDHLVHQVRDRGYGLVVIDTLDKFWPVEDENSATQVNRSLVPLRSVADEGAAVLLVHHSNKSGGKDGRSIRGSSAIGGFADVIITLERVSKPNRRRVTVLSRYENRPRQDFELTEGGYVLVNRGQNVENRDGESGTVIKNAQRIAQALWKYLQDRGGDRAPRADIQKSLGMGTASWNPAVEWLVGKEMMRVEEGESKKGGSANRPQTLIALKFSPSPDNQETGTPSETDRGLIYPPVSVV